MAIAIAIVVLLPVVLDLDTILIDPGRAYHPLRFQVLMGLSAVLLVAMLGIVILRRKRLGSVPVLIPALAFLGVSALSTLFSEDPSHSLFGDRNEGLLSLAAGVLLFYALARCLNSALRVRIFLAAGVTAGVLVSINGIFQRYGLDMISGWGNPWYTNPERSISTLGHPVALAAYLTLMMGAATALCFRKSGSSFWRNQAPWLFALAVIGACWIYTDTRGAWLGVTLMLPVVLWFSIRRMGTVRPLLVPLATMVVAMAATVVAWATFAKAVAGEVVASVGYAFGDLTLPLRIQNIPTIAMLVAYMALIGAVLWLSERGGRMVRFLLVTLPILVIAVGIAMAVVVSSNLASTQPATTNSDIDPSAEVRLYIWRDALPMLLDHPLLGQGPDNFEEPFESYISDDFAAVTSAATDRAHNEFLQVAATTGFLGLAAYLWVLVSYFRNVYQRGGWPLIALSGGVLAYVLQLQTGVTDIATNTVFWALLGTSVALMRIHDREKQSSEANNSRPPEETAIVGAAVLPTGKPGRRKGRYYELLIVSVVVGALAAIAIPAFLSQRQKAVDAQPGIVQYNVQNTVSAYELAKAAHGLYPEGGIYTARSPITDVRGGPIFTPSAAVTISTVATCAHGFSVEGESNTNVGTFTYSYDGITTPSSYPDISDSLAGENMSPSEKEDPSVASDATARDGLVFAFFSNGCASYTGRTTSTIEEIVFNARSDLAANAPEPAKLVLTIDGVSQGTLEIPGTTLSEHKFKLPEPLAPGVHIFDIRFINDYSDGSESGDRNLYIDHLTFAEAS